MAVCLSPFSILTASSLCMELLCMNMSPLMARFLVVPLLVSVHLNFPSIVLSHPSIPYTFPSNHSLHSHSTLICSFLLNQQTAAVDPSSSTPLVALDKGWSSHSNIIQRGQPGLLPLRRYIQTYVRTHTVQLYSTYCTSKLCIRSHRVCNCNGVCMCVCVCVCMCVCVCVCVCVCFVTLEIAKK